MGPPNRQPRRIEHSTTLPSSLRVRIVLDRVCHEEHRVGDLPGLGGLDIAVRERTYRTFFASK